MKKGHFLLEKRNNNAKLGKIPEILEKIASRKENRKVENFHIVQALCRASLAKPTPAILRQVERLRDALKKDGYGKEAKKLSLQLNAAQKVSEMAPSRIERSRIMASGEELTPRTPLPVDKGSATPLAEVIFPDNLPNEAPLFGEGVRMAVSSILGEWMHFEKLSTINASPSRSCLIFGAPGTGKTHLALWMAAQLNMPVILARLDGLMSSFLGTTSRNIGNLFSFANKYRCILLLDEFDAIAKLRDDPQEVGEIKRVVSTLLQNLDWRKDIGFTIGVTNHEGLLDPAVWRRFDVQLEIPRPGPEVMMRIIEKYMAPLNFRPEEIKFLAWSIEGGTGADAKNLVHWLKKAHILNGNSGPKLTGLVTQFALLNSGRIDRAKRNILVHGDNSLISALLCGDRYDFKQKEVASVLGTSSSALSKRLAKLKKQE